MASYYCGTAGQNTVVHCLCEASPPTAPPLAPPPAPAAPQWQYACTAAQIAASPYATRAHCTALHAAYSHYAPPGLNFDGHPTPGDDVLGVCVLQNACVDDDGGADISSACVGGVRPAETRDTQYDYVVFYPTAIDFYCSMAGRNTIVHCLCEASPPSAPPPAPPPMSDYLCGGHATSLYGTGANLDYFAEGAQNTVSVEFCAQMAALYDGGDSGGASLGVAPDHLLGLAESQTPSNQVCGGGDPGNCPPGTQGLCRITHPDFHSSLTGHAVFFQTHPDLLPSATPDDRAAFAVDDCITAPGGSSGDPHNQYYGCFCDMEPSPPAACSATSANFTPTRPRSSRLPIG